MAAVTVLTITWVIAIGVLLLLLFEVVMSQWVASVDDDHVGMRELRRQGAHRLLWLAAVMVGGPLVVAAVARASGMTRKAVAAYLVLAGILAVPALAIAVQASRTLEPASPAAPPGPPGHCVEFSGGDNRCPGG